MKGSGANHYPKASAQLHLIRPNLSTYGEMNRDWISHGKVISRAQQGQISSKQVKIACFRDFFNNYIHFRCLWWLETYLHVHVDPNTDPCQNTSRDCGIIIRDLEVLYPIKSPLCHPCLMWPNITLLYYVLTNN